MNNIRTRLAMLFMDVYDRHHSQVHVRTTPKFALSIDIETPGQLNVHLDTVSLDVTNEEINSLLSEVYSGTVLLSHLTGLRCRVFSNTDTVDFGVMSSDTVELFKKLDVEYAHLVGGGYDTDGPKSVKHRKMMISSLLNTIRLGMDMYNTSNTDVGLFILGDNGKYTGTSNYNNPNLTRHLSKMLP